MRTDHSFRSNELEEFLKILHKNVPEIFEDEVELDYEERLPKSQWDERYFTKLTYWFENNFTESRIPYIKEVGRTVFGKKIRMVDIMNISLYYESVILEQQVNYFILEDKYNELWGGVITEATDSKIEKFKTFISEKYKKLKEIIRKIINAIGKVLEKIFPFLKKKQNEKQQKDDNVIYVETYNIKNADKYIDTALKIEYDIEKIITNADKIKDEEVENKNKELSNAEKEFAELKDPRSGEKEKQRYNQTEFERYHTLFNSLKKGLERVNKSYDKDFITLYNASKKYSDHDDFLEKKKKYQYVMSGYTLLVKIYTSTFNIAKEICMDMVQADDMKKGIKNTNIPKKEYDILTKYMLDNDTGTWHQCTGTDQIRKAKEICDKYPNRFTIYKTIKTSRKDFIDHEILDDVNKLYDKFIKK